MFEHRPKEARELLDELEELSKKEYVPRYYKALVYAGLDDKDRAFAELEDAFRQHDVTMVILDTDPMLDNLRGDARFDSLLERIGLPRQRGLNARVSLAHDVVQWN